MWLCSKFKIELFDKIFKFGDNFGVQNQQEHCLIKQFFHLRVLPESGTNANQLGQSEALFMNYCWNAIFLMKSHFITFLIIYKYESSFTAKYQWSYVRWKKQFDKTKKYSSWGSFLDYFLSMFFKLSFIVFISSEWFYFLQLLWSVKVSI